MATASRDSGNPSAQGSGPPAHRPRFAPLGATNPGSQNFLKLVERTTDALVGGDESSVEDVRRTLIAVRQQYDAVHHEAEQKDARLRSVREAIRTADMLHIQKADEHHKLDQEYELLKEQMDKTNELMHESQTCQKVYTHMLNRIQKELAILREKMLKMEDHTQRKDREVHQKEAELERLHTERVQASRVLEAQELDADLERESCKQALESMEGELERRKDTNKRRADFESWRHDVALEAANEAFNRSAGRLRKLYAIEKLQGNSLQRVTNEQVERALTTERGFQKIRDVTGLNDVMDIVHKFLNRDIEHDQLKASVKEAEVRLESLRQQFEDIKRETEGITFDDSTVGREGDIFKDIEGSDRSLTDAMEKHEHTRVRMQKTTLQVEHVKRWSARIGHMLSKYDPDPVKVEALGDMSLFFQRLEVVVKNFVTDVAQQIEKAQVTKASMNKHLQREHHEQQRLLTNAQFLRDNCRVPAAPDGRPTSRQGGGADDDPGTFVDDERDRLKKESDNYAREQKTAQTRAETQKKSKKGEGR